MIRRTATALPTNTYGAATAGTTQTQAGATQLTAGVNGVTTGNASDGVGLPRADFPTAIGSQVIIENKSAVILKVWPGYITADSAGDGSAIDGGSANASVNQAASTTFVYICTAIKTWKSAKLS